MSEPSSSLAAPGSHAPTASIAALQDASIVKSFDSGLLKGPETETHERSETVLAVEDQKIVSSRLGIFREYDRTPKEKPIAEESPSPAAMSASATAAEASADKASIVASASTGSVDSADSWINVAESPAPGSDDGFLSVSKDSGHSRMGTAIVVPSADEEEDSEEPVLLAVRADDGVVSVEEAGLPEEKDADQEAQSALSLWQAKREVELAERKANEQRAKEQRLEEAEQFRSEERRKREEMVQRARVEKSGLESGVRAELQSVFERGSIWMQVARMVDLSKSDPRIERMRKLIIELKSE